MLDHQDIRNNQPPHTAAHQIAFLVYFPGRSVDGQLLSYLSEVMCAWVSIYELTSEELTTNGNRDVAAASMRTQQEISLAILRQ